MLKPLWLCLVVVTLALGATVWARAQGSRTAGIPCDPDNGGITLPDGFCALVFADNLGRARHVEVTAGGDVYVAFRNSDDAKGGVAALRDTNGDGRADVVERFGDDYGTAIEVREGYLYFGADERLVRYKLTPGKLTPEGRPEVVIDGFPAQRTHPAKPFAFDGKGSLFVHVGAPSNACQVKDREKGSPGQSPCPDLGRHAGVWRFDAGRTGQKATDGKLYATGIRHVVALEWSTELDGLYAVQHGRDQLDSIWAALFTAEQNAELPAEELLRISEGDDYGWPYCYFDPFQGKRVLAPEYGGDGKQEGDCGKRARNLLTFPAHWAPNDVLFYTGSQFPQAFRGGLFVAFHGSWNRAPLPQGGYQVVFVPFRGGKPEGRWEAFLDEFAGKTPPLNPRDARYRPTGLALGPDGSLYVSDSMKGRIWRVFYRG